MTSLRARIRLPDTYRSRVRSDARLKAREQRCRGPAFAFLVRGLSRSAHKAGLSEGVLNAEMRTETAIEKAKAGPLQRFFRAFNRAFDRTRGRYVSGSRILARRLVIGLGLLAGLTLIAVVLGKKTPTGFVTDEDQGYLFMNVELPAAASLQRTDEVCKQVESILHDTPGVRSYNTIAGFS